ncbi:hypothetical protein KI688_007250 [Linnemannia hyalina]|uniref:Uncharacterized protein n=1 Tax=Linnemannia hyalina TaxID=64524 RepID=A0A9P7XJG5_9FUNG|nr:hypothetical protein KI688_007250 [Linnemannia hyalina]
MPQPLCADYFNCSLPKEKRTAQHKKLYHDPQPTEIKATDGSHAKILVHRDPKRAMYFPCPHKECDHASILRTTPAKHHRRCHLFKRDQLTQRKQKATATVGAATPALTRCSSSLSSVSTLSSAPSCLSQGSDSDDVTSLSSSQELNTNDVVTPPSGATRQSESNDSRSPPPSPEPFTCASAADVHQLLLSVAFLAQTIDQLDGRVGAQEELTKRMTASRSNAARITKLEECMERISDQGDWLMADVHNQKKCAESFKRTVGSDMATVENHMETVKEHLFDLVPESHELKKQVKELQESVARLRATLRDIVDFDETASRKRSFNCRN